MLSFQITTFAFLFLLRNACFGLSVDHNQIETYERQEDLDVEFLFWSNSNSEESCVFDWWTWSMICTGESATFTVRFNSAVGPIFDDLLNMSNRDKFNPAGKTIFIIHGFGENGSKDWIERMANAYLEKDSDLNVISVEWSQLAKGPDYALASANTQIVGVHVGNFITYMVGRSETSFSLNDIHIVGFSLGAQVAGKAGETLNGQLGRITGLDPAELNFAQYEGKGTGQRLDSSDATFVDVIHTSANSNPDYYPVPIGNKEKLGHLDFWPNGGNTPMPGTEWSFLPGFDSHSRAVEYFTESISNPFSFRARRADSYDDFKSNGGCIGPEQMMGEAATSNGPIGNYYLETNGQFPYGKGQTCL